MLDKVKYPVVVWSLVMLVATFVAAVVTSSYTSFEAEQVSDLSLDWLAVALYALGCVLLIAMIAKSHGAEVSWTQSMGVLALGFLVFMSFSVTTLISTPKLIGLVERMAELSHQVLRVFFFVILAGVFISTSGDDDDDDDDNDDDGDDDFGSSEELDPETGQDLDRPTTGSDQTPTKPRWPAELLN